jgi:CRISPR-associated protein Cas1
MQPVHVSQFGVFLGKHSERLVIRQGKETLSEHPLLHVEQVLISGRGISFSVDLIQECCARGIPITLLTPGGKPYARVASTALTATVRTRREQVAAYADRRGADVARSVAAGKLRNQANLLRYFAKYRKQGATQVFE